jgi:microcystin-dependent protein
MKRIIFILLLLAAPAAFAQVKVGDNPTNVNSNAVLEAESATKGVLFPRVALTSTDSASPLSAFTAGMTVYNTASAGSGTTAVTPGLYYCDGAKWVPTGKDYVEDPTLGSIAVFPFNALPTGYLECNGAAVSRTTYAALFAKIGTTYGAGDGSTTFNLPDLRGEFIRGWDHGRGIDSGRTLASAQAGATKLPTNAFTGTTNNTKAPIYAEYGTNANVGYGVPGQYNQLSTSTSYGARTEYSANHNHTFTVTGGGDAETRPRNVAMVYAIKAVESILVPSSTSSAIAGAAASAAAASEPWYKVGTITGASANTDNVYINGKVGIGTSNPYGNFNVDCGSSGGWVAFSNLYTNAGLLFNANANQAFIQFEGTPGPDTSLNLGARGSGLADLTINGATGNVGIGTTTPDASAALDVTSTDKGVLFPRMTQAQRTAIASPATGLLVYQTGGNPNLSGYYYYSGTSWTKLASLQTNYVGYVDAGDIGAGGTSSIPFGGFVVSATKSYPADYCSIITVTHNLGLTGAQDIQISNRGLTVSAPSTDNDVAPPLVYNVTANSFQVFMQETAGVEQNLRLMIQLTHY